MNPTQDRLITFRRRAFILSALQGTAFLGLSGRMYWLQVEQKQRFKKQAEANRIARQILLPPRGLILDRNQVPMVENKMVFHAMLDRSQIRDWDAALAKLKTPLTLDEQDIKSFFKRKKRTPNRLPILVKAQLSFEELAAMELLTATMDGLRVIKEPARLYPLAQKAAHITGYVAPPNDVEAKDDAVLLQPGAVIGKDGLEKAAESTLRGTAGAQLLEVNARGLAVKKLDRSTPLIGKNLQTTLDFDLQNFAYDQLGDESGSIVVMDVTNGHILAATSAPAFDPNAFVRGITHEYWGKLTTNKKSPLLNKPFIGQYAPGSTFKMLVGLAILEEKIADQYETVYCPGHFYLGRQKFHCWKKGGHGRVNLREALSKSCDTYFYHMANKMGIAPIAAMAQKFGMGAKTGLNMLSERAGLVPTPDWKRKRHNESWAGGDTVNASIGQGFVLCTPLQMAVFTARLATNKLVTPSLTPQIADFADLMLNPSHLDLVQSGMYDVVNKLGGTAFYRARLKGTEAQMAGKTGTVQVARITAAMRAAGQVKAKDRPWHLRNHALFVGYAPFDKPKYAISVVVEHGNSGSGTAAPIAKNVMEKALA